MPEGVPAQTTGVKAEVKKIPTWGWIVVGLVVGGLILAYIKYRQSQAAAASTGLSGSAGTTGAMDPGQDPAIGQILSQLQSIESADQNMQNLINQQQQQIQNLINHPPASNAAAPPPPPTPAPPTNHPSSPNGGLPSGHFYTVTRDTGGYISQYGDLNNIAAAARVPLSSLLAWNPYLRSNPNLVYTGWKVWVPTGGHANGFINTGPNGVLKKVA